MAPQVPATLSGHQIELMQPRTPTVPKGPRHKAPPRCGVTLGRVQRLVEGSSRLEGGRHPTEARQGASTHGAQQEHPPDVTGSGSSHARRAPPILPTETTSLPPLDSGSPINARCQPPLEAGATSGADAVRRRLQTLVRQTHSSAYGRKGAHYSCPAAFCCRTDQCCSVTAVWCRMSAIPAYGTNCTALLTA